MDLTQKIQIAGIVENSVVDGPGIRFAIFTQGCPFRCKGCHNPQTQNRQGGVTMTAQELFDEITKNPLVQGVTFSGGDPLLQSDKLVNLAQALRSSGYSLWAYTGFTYERALRKHLPFISTLDVLVDGQFVKELKEPRLMFRGSSNQRLIDVQRSLKENQVILFDV